MTIPQEIRVFTILHSALKPEADDKFFIKEETVFQTSKGNVDEKRGTY